jgi:hypothetical protein
LPEKTASNFKKFPSDKQQKTGGVHSLITQPQI